MASSDPSPGTPPGQHQSHNNSLWFRLASFLVGAAILIIEIEVRKGTRIWVVGLSLVLMGIVTIEQVIDWADARHKR